MIRRSELMGVYDLYKDCETVGSAKAVKFSFSESTDPIYNLRILRDGEPLFYMFDGFYVKLLINGKIMMSDTNMERLSNEDFVNRAHGRVLIGGLGLGLILHNILDKERVEEIVVVEHNRDVIDLVVPKFKNDKLTIVNDDIFTYKPIGEFDVIYFDIWAEVRVDNLTEMLRLERRYKKYLNKKNSATWISSWMKKECLKHLKEEKEEEAYLKRLGN